MYQLDPIWSLAANLGYTERAPTFYELYANGAHVATGAFEVGDASLNKEKAKAEKESISDLSTEPAPQADPELKNTAAQ